MNGTPNFQGAPGYPINHSHTDLGHMAAKPVKMAELKNNMALCLMSLALGSQGGPIAPHVACPDGTTLMTVGCTLRGMACLET